MYKCSTKAFRILVGSMLIPAMSLCVGCNVPGFGRKDNKLSARRAHVMPVAKKSLPPAQAKPDHLALARQLIDRGYHDVALVQLREAAKQNAGKAELYYLTGVCEREEGRLREAEKAFRQAIRIDPDLASAHDGLGITLFALGKGKDAQKAFERAVSLNPGRPDFQNNLGYAYLRNGLFAKAEIHFRKSIALDPGFHQALNNLGFCLVRLGRDAEALRVFRRIMPPGEAYNNLGVAYERRGECHKALALYKKALREAPRLAPAKRNAQRVEKALAMAKIATPALPEAELFVIPGLPADQNKSTMYDDLESKKDKRKDGDDKP